MRPRSPSSPLRGLGRARWSWGAPATSSTRQPTSAEVAFMVAIDWQRLGLGSALQEQLQDHATRHGVRGLVAEILPGNTPMLQLAAKARGEVTISQRRGHGPHLGALPLRRRASHRYETVASAARSATFPGETARGSIGRAAKQGQMAEDRKAPVTRKPDGKPAEVSSSGEIDAFLRQARALGAPARGPRPADLRARRDDEPPADLGHRLPAPGGDVRGGGQGRRARGAARLLPRLRRMPRQPLGERHPRAPRPDDRHRCPRRPDPDRQGSVACAARGAEAQGRRRWSSSATRWRSRSTRWRRRPANSACSASACSSSRRGATRRSRRGFRELARLTGGAYARFDTNAAGQLAQLLRAVGGLCGRRPEGAGEAGRGVRPPAPRADAVRADALSLRRRRGPGHPDPARRAPSSAPIRGRWSGTSATSSAAVMIAVRRRAGARAALGARRAADRRRASRRWRSAGSVRSTSAAAAAPPGRRRRCARPSSTCSSTTTAAR